jgi:hypothetical protein
MKNVFSRIFNPLACVPDCLNFNPETYGKLC